MEKGTNNSLRQEYEQNILSSEQKLDQLSKEKRQVQDLIHSLEIELNDDFQAIHRLNDELIKEESLSARWLQEELLVKHRYFRQSMNEDQHALMQLYNQAEKSEVEERQALLKERNDLVWD